MALNIKPLSRVLIEPVAAETKTAFRVLIPLKKTTKGTVVAVGMAQKNTMTVKIGDSVLRKIFRYRAEIRR
jgi:co-chaperonin GroES (HSP10)